MQSFKNSIIKNHSAFSSPATDSEAIGNFLNVSTTPDKNV